MICASLAKLCTAYSYSAFCYDTVPRSTEVEVLHSPIARAGEMRERTGIICSKLYLCIESIGHALHINYTYTHIIQFYNARMHTHTQCMYTT